MGDVYRAKDTRLRRDVAVKVMSEVLSEGATWERFEREARAASALNHPNICTIHDVGEAGGRPFLVMELIEGRTLTTYIGDTPLDAGTAVAFAVQIADALDAAHSRGIIHRDIKPGNIMITGRSHVTVLDFGLARQTATGEFAELAETMTLEPLSVVGTVVGTPRYLSPEVLGGSRADARSDLWALGVVMYEMLSGRAPFTGATAFEMSSRILNQPHPPLPASVPSPLRAIVDRCLAKRPEDRYQRASEVRTALQALRSGATPEAMPRRRRWMWVAGVAAAVLALAVTIWPRLEGTSGRRLSTGGPASASREANELFDLAMNFQRVQNDIPRAQEALGRALTIDPGFAEALRFHAINYVTGLLNGYTNDTSVLYRAEEELRRAAREAPDLASLPSALVAVYVAQGRKELAPVEQLDLVLRRDPSQNDARLWRMILHKMAEENVAAKEEAGILLEREPLLGVARMLYGDILRTEGDVSGAIREERRVLEQAPGNISAIRFLTLAYLDSGQVEQARTLLEETRPLFPGNYLWRQTWALLRAVEGRREEAIQMMDVEVEKFAAGAFIVTIENAEFYAVLGDMSKAIEWLERAVRNGDERVAWFRRSPRLAAVREDPRFAQVIDSVEARRRQK